MKPLEWFCALKEPAFSIHALSKTASLSPTDKRDENKNLKTKRFALKWSVGFIFNFRILLVSVMLSGNLENTVGCHRN